MVSFQDAISKIYIGKNTRVNNIPLALKECILRSDSTGTDIVLQKRFEGVPSAKLLDALKTICFCEVRADQIKKYESIMQEIANNNQRGIFIDYGFIYNPYRKCFEDSLQYVRKGLDPRRQPIRKNTEYGLNINLLRMN